MSLNKQEIPLKNVVVAGYGGISAAGRSSAGHGFRRIVFDALTQKKQQQTLNSLAQVMGLKNADPSTQLDSNYLLKHSLIRHWDNIHWNPEKVPFHHSFIDDQGQTWWKLEYKKCPVQGAAQAPKGFDPALLYPSHHHPRGLQMAVYGASDALHSTGVEWDTFQKQLQPDEIAVYAGAAMGQLNPEGHGGMLQAATLGKRTSSKQCAFGLSQMPADFINAYVLGNVGATGTMVGACATFLYNLKLACDDIRSGKRRLVLVGTSEAPLEAEIIEGYHAMTALVTEKKLKQLDGLSNQSDQSSDYKNASRPFGENAGFTLAESAQFFVLCDEALTLELGLTIHASIGEVFIHADGYKKSISSPGIGNYITVGKAMAAAQKELGKEALTKGSYVQAHGSSTPQNRTTEADIFSSLAKTFEIENWPITAVKAHLGHSLASASADQLFTSIGAWQEGILPGITTVQAVAEDVNQDNLHFVLKHETFDSQAMPLAFLNAKGFGGNNATAYIISPQKSCERIEQQLNSSGESKTWQDYLKKNALVKNKAKNYDSAMTSGEIQPKYHFNHNVLDPSDLIISASEIRILGQKSPIPL